LAFKSRTNLNYMINKRTAKVYVTQQEIDRIMFLAIEGGIDRWCYYVAVKNKDYNGTTSINEVISNNGTLQLYTRIQEEPFELNIKLLKKGFQKYIFDNELYTIKDLSTIDVDYIIQLSIFGEIKYKYMINMSALV
jgi:hypothetical protein